MRTVGRLALLSLAALITVALVGAGMLMYWPRPPDTTATAVFAGDGAELDYCDLRELDGDGARADEIPKAYTPACGWSRWPMPVLATCAEPLAPGADDLRGLWLSTDPQRPHVERIEQCGDRTVITTAGIIHDFHTDGTLARGSRDIEPPSCMNTWVAIDWHDGVMRFRPLGGPIVAVTRRREGDEVLWRYLERPEMRMRRICSVPEAFRTMPAH